MLSSFKSRQQTWKMETIIYLDLWYANALVQVAKRLVAEIANQTKTQELRDL